MTRPTPPRLSRARAQLLSAASAAAAALLMLAGGGACKVANPSHSASEGSSGSSTEAETSTGTSGSGSGSESGSSGSGSESGGEVFECGDDACELFAPFAVNIPVNPSTHETCGQPHTFFAYRDGANPQNTVIPCPDETCLTGCIEEDSYNLAVASANLFPTDQCVRIIHETQDIEGECRSRAFSITHLEEKIPFLVVVGGPSPEPPADALPGLTVAVATAQACECTEPDERCCEGTVVARSLEFSSPEGQAEVAPGLSNVCYLPYGAGEYEIVVTRSYETCDGELVAGWYMDRR